MTGHAPAQALGAVAAALVRGSARRPRWVSAALLAVTLLAALFAAARFELDSDLARLFPPDLPWRLAEQRMERAFPERTDLIAVVVDAPSAAAAELAAERLAERLRAHEALFRSVRRPDAGEFWERHGLLYLETPELAALLERLIEAQPLLGTLAADPSLRGVAELARLVAEGAARGERVAAAGPALAALAEAAEAALAGSAAPPDWQTLLTGRAAAPLELRRFVLVRPAPLEFGHLSAGAAATAAIREAAAGLRLEGVRVRVTGLLPMEGEELATVADGVREGAAISLALVALLLWLALRSARLIAPLLLLIVAGLACTAAIGLLLFGAFNPLSVAFAVLFIGIGVDFGIQLSVQYRAQRLARPDRAPAAALERAAREAGPGMTLAALAVAGSFLALWPTEYRGVAELGAVAGTGMAVGWFLALTLLPALIVLARPGAERGEVGYPALAVADRWLAREAGGVLRVAVGLAAAALLAALFLRFDTNPINLRDPDSEAVATWRDLARDPQTSPYALDALAPGLEAAAALAARLAALPEVGQATSLASFVPPAQPEKLALLRDAELLLGASFLAEPRPAPSDGAAAAALARAAAALAVAPTTEAARLAGAFAALADSPAETRQRFAAALLPDLARQLARVQALLSAEAVSPASLPAELRADWVTADGRHRVAAAPAIASDDPAELRRFARAVQALAPDATGLAVSTLGAAATIQRAFVESGAIALGLVLALLLAALRSVRLALLALAPLALATLLTLAHCAVFGPDLNLANIIALPLLLGLGVAYDIYFVAAWQAGRRGLLASPLNRAVIFSALTNAAAFAALALSPHPGTASMGVVLSLSLLYSLACVLLVLPPLLHRFAPREVR